ncbi:MAG: response regulator [Desulfobacterales bacterium]|jgi:CheY-like chemotaxis protein
MQVVQSKNNGKNETVLFVDDEKIVLEVGSLMLQKLGYSVLAVSNGNRAIEILKKNKVAFVLLDMLMPGMNGFQIYHRLKNIQPNVKIILTSGHAVCQSEGQSERIGFDGFIQKPFNLKQLSEKIENIREN